MGDICGSVTYLEIEEPDIDLSRTYGSNFQRGEPQFSKTG